MSDHEEHSKAGVYSVKGKEFDRDSRYIETRIVAEPRPGTDDYPVEPGRYRLIAAYACPWANRAIIVRDLLGLQDVISLGTPGRRTTPTRGPSTSTRAASTPSSASTS